MLKDTSLVVRMWESSRNLLHAYLTHLILKSTVFHKCKSEVLFWQGWDAGGRAEREGESGREDGRTEGVTSVCDVTSRCDVMRGAA